MSCQCHPSPSFDHAMVQMTSSLRMQLDNIRDAKQHEWDLFFLGVAKQYATKSKDPSTKVGAVIIRSNKTQVSAGFNGFPRGMRDDPARYADRPEKYSRTIHAELNALLFAMEDLEGCTMYVSFFPCSECARLARHMGIRRIVCPRFDPVEYERWKESYDQVQKDALEMGFVVDEVDFK